MGTPAERWARSWERHRQVRETAVAGRETTMIFDGLNVFIRNFTVVPEMDSNGGHVGGLVGTLRSVKALVRDVRPARVIVVWDGPGGSRRRRGIMSEYKSGRKPRVNREFDFGDIKESKRSFSNQYLRTRQHLSFLGVTQVEVEDVEADDVIALLCRMLPDEQKLVVSTDRDLLQLVDKDTVVYSPVKKVHYSTQVMREQLQVLPENYIYVKALDGDSSDNVKVASLKGLGPKTIAKVFPVLNERPTSLEELLSLASEGAKGKNRSVARWCQKIIDARDELYQNVQLMQLSVSILSPQAMRSVREQQAVVPDLALSSFRLEMMRDGVQLRDSDFETVFKDYHNRALRARGGAKESE